MLAPKWAGEFQSFQDWVRNAQSALTSPTHTPAVCIDTKGRRCTLGQDFMRARDEGAFPIRYFWEFEDHPAAADALGTERATLDTSGDIELQSSISPLDGGYVAGYPITGKVWFRHSTNEWVLELQGTINDCYFTSRHTEPRTTAPEDVAALPSLYDALPAEHPPQSIDTPDFRERIDRLRRHSSISTRGQAAYKALIAEIDTKLGVRPAVLYPRRSGVDGADPSTVAAGES